MTNRFTSLVVHEDSSGSFNPVIEERQIADLPEGDVLIEVHYAALNYKDALSCFGHKGITRKYPHTPGVDASGVVIEDKTGRFSSGDKVICTSFDLGMNVSGGLGGFIRVPVHWVVPLPVNLDLRESMILGTAAYTAGLALYKMEISGQSPDMGPIVVTGASGGVGSMAIAILSKVGYHVIASSGKMEQESYLKSLGASQVVGREFVDDKSSRPLLSPKWAGAIDNVGGNTLATLLKACSRNGNVASIGLVDSADLNTTIFPFILNGINLLGIDSAETEIEQRHKIWEKISLEWKPTQLENICTDIDYNELISSLQKVKNGETVGRLVLKHEH